MPLPAEPSTRLSRVVPHDACLVTSTSGMPCLAKKPFSFAMIKGDASVNAMKPNTAFVTSGFAAAAYSGRGDKARSTGDGGGGNRAAKDLPSNGVDLGHDAVVVGHTVSLDEILYCDAARQKKSNVAFPSSPHSGTRIGFVAFGCGAQR